ncbi:carboxylesterase [Propionivibrio soli]|uniref:alpha/beta hydrolase n=1 Tax=Propionivibrio soli TaxID=2976531 RepID=UPI00308411F7
MEPLLPAIEMETGESPRFSIIWLHGLGADGSDFVPVVEELQLPAEYPIRFVFPHAPHIPVTCNGGYIMRAWYDIVSLDSRSRHVDDPGIRASCEAVGRLIERENERGVPSERVFLAGFSQGGAIAYTTALTYPHRLAGVIALSTYIPGPGRLAHEAAAANRGIACFAGHGSDDEVVAIDLGIAARNFLQQHGYPVEWHTYSMTHSVCQEELTDIGLWLTRKMAAAGDCLPESE